MKIAVVLPSLDQKAPIIVARDLTKGLLSKGCDVTVFYFDDIKKMDFPCRVVKIDFKCFRHFKDYDIVHTHSLRPDLFAVLCNFFGSSRAKFVTTIHNIVEEDLFHSYGKLVSFFFSRIWRHAWRWSDRCVVLTAQALSYYRETQPGLKLSQIYNGRPFHIVEAVALEDEEKIRLLRNDYRVIGACAGLSTIKGLEQVIRALPGLPGYCFLLIGDGPAREGLQELAKQLGVGNRLLSLGYRANARDYLPFMNVYAMPSRSEGLPLALLEAVSAGVPVVCSDIPQFREVFSSDEVAYFKLDDIDGFVSAIKFIEADGELISKNAMKHYQASYTLEVMTERYFQMYRDIGSRIG